MVFYINYNGLIYRIANVNFTRNRHDKNTLTDDEKQDRVMRILRSIRYYAKIDKNKYDEQTIIDVFNFAVETKALPDWMSEFKFFCRLQQSKQSKQSEQSKEQSKQSEQSEQSKEQREQSEQSKEQREQSEQSKEQREQIEKQSKHLLKQLQQQVQDSIFI